MFKFLKEDAEILCASIKIVPQENHFKSQPFLYLAHEKREN